MFTLTCKFSWLGPARTRYFSAKNEGKLAKHLSLKISAIFAFAAILIAFQVIFCLWYNCCQTSSANGPQTRLPKVSEQLRKLRIAWGKNERENLGEGAFKSKFFRNFCRQNKSIWLSFSLPCLSFRQNLFWSELMHASRKLRISSFKPLFSASLFLTS